MSRLFLPAPHGRLEALWEPVSAARGTTLVCHPSPQLGGTMNDRVIYRLAKAWMSAGHSVLRFNFRGVGLSTGQISSGEGPVELEDAEVAWQWLRAQGVQEPLFVSGYSYGSRTALQLSQQHPEIRGVLAVAYAANLFDSTFLAEQVAPSVFIHGDNDEYASLPTMRALMKTIPAPSKLIEVQNADHRFLGGKASDAVTQTAHDMQSTGLPEAAHEAILALEALSQ